MTITAPIIEFIKNEPIYVPGDAQTYTLNGKVVAAKGVFKDIENLTVTINGTAAVYQPGGKVFSGPMADMYQEMYDEYVEMGADSRMLDDLVEDAINDGCTVEDGEASETPMTAENASEVFGSANVTFYNHKHSFTYTADGDTITATCSAEDCDLTDSKATLTIAAPENLAYDGTAKEAVITDADGIRGEATVNYYIVENDAKGDALTGAPTDIGKYWAEITLGTGDNAATAHVVYEISFGSETTAALNVTGNDGTTCRAAILDENYNEIDSVTKKAGEKFILLVNREDEYDFEVTGATTTEFTEEEYTASALSRPVWRFVGFSARSWVGFTRL